MRGSSPQSWGQRARWHCNHPAHPLKLLAMLKAIAGMSGRFIISALSLASPFTPTIGDGLSTSTKGTAGVNMRAAVTGVKAAGSKSTKTW